MVENDVIRSLKYEFAVEDSYYPVLKWLLQQLDRARSDIREHLPFKSKKYNWPHFLWIEPTTHKGYTDLKLRKAVFF